MARKVKIVGVPLDLGQGRRGVDMGPSALRVAGLNARLRDLGCAVEDAGNVPVAIAETHGPGDPKAKYLKEVAETCRKHAIWMEGILRGGFLPIVLGGDHSVAVGTVAGVSNFYRRKKKKIGLIWIDAHADINTPETSPSGNIHGMPMACCIGLGPVELSKIFGYAPKVAPGNVVLVGARDLDEGEKLTLKAQGVHTYTMRDIDERGMRAVMKGAIEVASHGTAGFAVSFDMDSVDPTVAPGVGTPVPGGISYREAHLAMEMIAETGNMVSLVQGEMNKVIDTQNKTAILGVELALSALGKKIL